MTTIKLAINNIIPFLKNLANEPLYPILFTLYPILFLYDHNISELTIDVLYVPILLSVALTSLSLIILKIILNSWQKSALLNGALILVFYLYQPIIDSLPHELFSIGNLSITRGLLVKPLAFALLALTVTLAFRIKDHRLSKMSLPINILMLLLIISPIVNIFNSEIARYNLIQDNAYSMKVFHESEGSKLPYLPDVYYIVFDRYAGERTLSEMYGYDNGEFLNLLEDRGFYIASNSHSNYPSTELSISSTLNLDFHQSYSGSGPYPDVATSAYTKLARHKVGQTFKSFGYKYYQFTMSLSWLKNSEIANESLYYKKGHGLIEISNFSEMLIRKSALAAFGVNLFPSVEISPFNEAIESTLWQRRNIPHVVSLRGPKLVYAHFLLPHDPYVFDSQCNSLEESEFTSTHSIPRYLDQLKCTNKIATEFVDTILNSSTNNPIIILQADEGPHVMVNQLNNEEDNSNAGNKNFTGASVDAIQERTRIINAFYFPDSDYRQLYENITPVNTFRTVFRQYFNMDTPNLNDKVYVFPSFDRMFNFIDVTEKLK